MKIYVGHDSREDIAYQVCEYSMKRFNPEVNVTPLIQQDLRQKKVYWRELDKLASTEFTFTRFFVPYLNDFKGWAVFCDCDFLWKSLWGFPLGDIPGGSPWAHGPLLSYFLLGPKWAQRAPMGWPHRSA